MCTINIDITLVLVLLLSLSPLGTGTRPLLPSLCAVGLIDANRAEGRGNGSLCMVLCQAFLGDQTVPLRRSRLRQDSLPEVDNRRGLYEAAMQKRAGTG